MASLLENDSSEDDFREDFRLAERLRINRENKVDDYRKKNNMEDQSSSSSLEMHSEPLKAGTSRAHGSHNKKRQNGDKHAELFANPKRTCLGDRIPKYPDNLKKKLYNEQFRSLPPPHCSNDTAANNLFADKTYEDHIRNLADEQNTAFNSSKMYSKKGIFNSLGEQSKSVEDVTYLPPNSVKSKPHNLRNGINKINNLDSNSHDHYIWKSPLSDQKEHPLSVERTLRPESYSAHQPEFYQEFVPTTGANIVHYVDSASDEDSRPLLKNGSLKGGRQSPELSMNSKKIVGRRIKKKVLDSDEESEEDWPSANRSRPCLIFSSSDSEVEGNSRRKTTPKASITPGSIVDHTYSSETSVKNTNQSLCQKPNQEYQPSNYFTAQDIFAGPSSSSYNPQTTSRSYKNPKNSRSNTAFEVSPTGFHPNRSGRSAVRGRNRVNVGERFTRRTGSPHPRTLPNSLPRMTRADVSKSAKGRALTGSHSRRANLNLATTYPDLFDAEDSSEVEFFTANSYSDTETSAESFGGLRISTTVMNPENNDVICEHSINVGSSEDEISVVFSTGPGGSGTRVENHVIRNSEPRRSTRALGRRRSKRGSWRQLHDNVRVVSLSPDPVEQVRQVEDDERFARMLQAQFDAEVDPTYNPPNDPTYSSQNDPAYVRSNGPRPIPSTIPISFRVESNTPTRNMDSDLGEFNDFNFLLDNFAVPVFSSDLPYETSLLRNSRSRNLPPIATQRRLERNRRRMNDGRNPIARLFEASLIGLPFGDIMSSDDGLDNFEAFLELAEISGEVPRGLQKSEINRLPTRQYKVMSSDGPSTDLPHKRAGLNKECQVCLSDYKNGDTLRILPCFHEFHTPCIDPWLKINHTCPVCRVVVDLED